MIRYLRAMMGTLMDTSSKTFLLPFFTTLSLAPLNTRWAQDEHKTSTRWTRDEHKISTRWAWDEHEITLNQLLDIACNVLDTAMEVGRIGTMKLGMGNILNVLISRANDMAANLASAQTLYCPSKREQCLTHSQECPPFQDATFPKSPEDLQSVCKLSFRIFNRWTTNLNKNDITIS